MNKRTGFHTTLESHFEQGCDPTRSQVTRPRSLGLKAGYPTHSDTGKHEGTGGATITEY